MSFAKLNGPDESFPKVQTGWCFENVKRNGFLQRDPAAASKLPKAHKTGTTICGVVFDGGIVLGADTRATSELIVDKNCEKIHYIAPNIYCCGAGTAADTEATTANVSSQLHLLRLDSGVESRVVTALTMLKRYLFNYQGYVSAALVLGGVDATGPGLYTVYPHGSTDKLPYVTMGSGSLAAMSVFETGFKDKMTRDEALKLVENAIRAGIFNDLGSGSNVDYCIIERINGEIKVENRRNYGITGEQNDVKKLRAPLKTPPQYGSFPVGTADVVEEKIEAF